MAPAWIGTFEDEVATDRGCYAGSPRCSAPKRSLFGPAALAADIHFLAADTEAFRGQMTHGIAGCRSRRMLLDAVRAGLGYNFQRAFFRDAAVSFPDGPNSFPVPMRREY